MKINEFLKEYRINNNMSLRQVSRLTGYSIERLQRFEKDRDIEKPESMTKVLAVTYGVRLKKLTENSGYQ